MFPVKILFNIEDLYLVKYVVINVFLIIVIVNIYFTMYKMTFEKTVLLFVTLLSFWSTKHVSAGAERTCIDSLCFCERSFSSSRL